MLGVGVSHLFFVRFLVARKMSFLVHGPGLLINV